MSSELELLKQRITELEAENVEIAELKKENAELRKENTDFRMKFANFEAERAELKRKIAETLRMTEEERTRRDAENVKLRATIEELRKNNTKESAELRDRITKVEQNQSLNDNSSNNSLPSFNSVADQVPTVTHHKKPLVDTSLPEDKEMDAFLDEEYKKKVSNEIRQRNREKKLCFSTSGQIQESLPTHPKEKMSQDLNSVTQPCNSTSSEEKICSELDSKCKKGKSVDKLKQELFASELSSQEPSIEQNHVTKISETLCPRKLNGIIESSGGKFGEKKARGLLYDSITKQLNLLRKQRSQETGLQLRDVSRDSLRKKTQRAEKVYKFIEQVGLDKIKYIKSYNATSISELTNEQIQDVIDYGISSEKLPLVTDHVTEISETLCPRKNLPVNTPDQNNVLEVLFPKESTAPIPLAHDSVPKRPSNSSDNSKEEVWFDEDMFFNEANPTKVNTVTSDDDVYFGEANEVNKHDGDSNSINDDSDSDSNSEDEIPDDSDDDGYGGYGGYNEYSERDRGYYYRDGDTKEKPPQ
ncbi:hypothetical protein GLOIN_2v1652170 [Rhizophagus irregularis DAOM 181602=DAOM 197198]|nr:hypothetical protein GLOIN_2v1652170 [Rhizophagus irregularis DAOM 181602=DAOM 197198]